ncbi:MAG: hypothetical protein PWP65_1926 [Clostridia bacterium]|nr:hypothetical protein [Clostridia bacterium]
MPELWAEVVLNSVPHRSEHALTYTVPLDLQGKVREGSLVLVPLIKREATGVVVSLVTSKPPRETKEIRAVLREELLPPALTELVKWLSERYFCPPGLALKAVIPAAVGQKLEPGWRWLAGGQEAPVLHILCTLRPELSPIASYLAKKKWATSRNIKKRWPGENIAPLLDLLQEHGLAREEYFYKDAVKPKNAEAIESPPSSLAAPIIPKLTVEQKQAIHQIKAALAAGQGGVFLLHGVTGSGKTEVYLRAVEAALATGKQAIVLVPEHALILQMAAVLKARFNDKVMIMHSKLPAGERAWAWEQARSGAASVALGSRTAIFTPFTRLGLIIIDEEHEPAYKQENQPRYHAREVALKRSKLEKAVVLLGSATPTLEAYYAARQGKSTLLTLSRRIEGADLPKVTVIDLRSEYRSGYMGSLSRYLLDRLQATLAAGKQAILFLNRRGYAPHVVCRFCGHIPRCRHCAVALTYHAQAGELCCHYCGFRQPWPSRCPRCGGDLWPVGVGTERVEEEVRLALPGADILRADADTTSRRGSWEKIYQKFAAGKGDILLGTQMVAKGLDFPGVSLVGIVNADLTLYLPDFRARERTFELLVQVAGRAGRRGQQAEVVIQSFNPGDPAIRLAATQDYVEFYCQEVAERRRLNYPPFSRLARIGIMGRVEKEVIQAALTLAELIAGREKEVTVLGPAPAPLVRLRGFYRWQLVLKASSYPPLRRVLKLALDNFRGRQKGIGKVILETDTVPMGLW